MSAEHDWRGNGLVSRIREKARQLNARGSIIIQDEIKRQLSLRASPPSSPAGEPPALRTGTLRRAVQIDLTGLTEPNPSVDVGPDLRVAPYARIQELGGTIRPRRAKALAVPIGQEGRRAARESLRSLRSLNLTLVLRRGRPPLLVRKGPRGSFKPLFVLLNKVTLPARPYMRPASQLARPRILGMYRREGLLR